ncbi:hypothetical protein [Mycolicibacterium phlei]|uniref:hypothetical protein n=1 Tax=Mycolicibacterium phlei TaxID=1771 RepID=UPI00030CB539|nr:hypothetical protein [Mycolicibacterium phlei]MBF4194628.1 hypothetical protein [Mycolicibacterium phlei]
MSNQSDRQEAIELLYRNIGALPDPEFGHINLLPFSVDSDEVNALKRKVCESIVNLFADAGYPMTLQQAPAQPEQMRNVKINCRLCSTTLIDFPVGSAGVANVAAATAIAAMSRLNPQCPHKPLTAEDQRRAIEEAVRIAEGGAN